MPHPIKDLIDLLKDYFCVTAVVTFTFAVSILTHMFSLSASCPYASIQCFVRYLTHTPLPLSRKQHVLSGLSNILLTQVGISTYAHTFHAKSLEALSVPVTHTQAVSSHMSLYPLSELTCIVK